MPANSTETAQVAKILGMQQPHLQRAIRQGKVKAPALTVVGGVKVRLWTKADIQESTLGARQVTHFNHRA